MITDLLVSKISRGRLQIPNNRYTDKEDRGNYWKLTFRYARLPDRALDFWFPDEASARKVGEKGVISLSEAFKLMAPLSDKFVPTGIAKDRFFTGRNRYTDEMGNKPAWHTTLWCEQTDRYADLWYGDDTQASQAQASAWYGLPSPSGGSVGGLGGAIPLAPAGPAFSYSPPDFLRLFMILILVYPAFGDYSAEISVGGFVDVNGYHKPGYYPEGAYPAGFEIGAPINLGPVGVALGHYEFVTIAQAQALGLTFGVPLSQWIVAIYG
jgi:hypothetical protein